MKKLVAALFLLSNIISYPMQQSAAASSSSPESLERKIKRLSAMIEQGLPSALTPNTEAANRDLKQLDLLFKNLKVDMRSGEGSEANKSVIETYDVLNNHTNQGFVNAGWVSSRLFFITLAEGKRIVAEHDMVLARQQRVDGKTLLAYIANFQQARTNELATLEFDTRHYKKPKFKDPKKTGSAIAKK